MNVQSEIDGIVRRSLLFIYVGINAACILFLMYTGHRVSSTLIVEQRIEPDGVDGVTFFVASAPALGVALLVNAAWSGKAVVDAWRHRGYGSFVWLGAGATMWGVAALAARSIWNLTAGT